MAANDVTGTIRAGVRQLLIDRQLPRFEARTVSTVVVDAGTEYTYRAVRALDPDEVGRTVPFMRLMARVRELPAIIAARARRGETASPAAGALHAEQYRQAFLAIDEEPGTELVMGMIGKFMSPAQMEFRRFDSPEFAGFSEPGYGKVAFNFLVLYRRSLGPAVPPLLEGHRPVRRLHHAALADPGQAARRAGQVAAPSGEPLGSALTAEPSIPTLIINAEDDGL